MMRLSVHSGFVCEPVRNPLEGPIHPFRAAEQIQDEVYFEDDQQCVSDEEQLDLRWYLGVMEQRQDYRAYQEDVERISLPVFHEQGKEE